MSTYLSKFYKLKASMDILDILLPISNLNKEITEAWAIVKRLQRIVLKEPGKYTIYDICAGNALISTIAAFLLPAKQVVAIDILPRNRRWGKIRNFTYLIDDIYKIGPTFFEKDSIIVANHPCGELSNYIVELYNKSRATHLILMPCCIGNINSEHNTIRYNKVLTSKLGKYLLWCMQLSHECKGKGLMIEDTDVISPKNCLIVAKKETK